MSITVVSIPAADHALIAVDTACIAHRADGSIEHSEAAKLHVLAHAGTVLAGTGSLDLAHGAFRWASAAKNADFDVIARALRDRLDHILAEELRWCKGDPVEAEVVAGGNKVYLVGWSPAESRMRGLVFIQDAGETNFREYDTRSRWAHPHDPASEGRQPQTVDEIALRACSAVRYGKSISSNPGGYGMRLVIAELRPGCISTFVRPATL